MEASSIIHPSAISEVVAAPAKLNLHLRVGPVREDGFHPLVSWMVTTSLCDTLTLAARDDGRIELACDDPSLPVDETNLVVRAARALQNIAGQGVGTTSPTGAPAATGACGPAGAETAAGLGVSVHLSKRIPAGGGLGGGSSDAAATLVALDRLWRLGLGVSQLATLAAGLGSDVPFFLHAPSAWCRGRGERVTPCPPPAVARHALLILPGISMPTPAVYRAFDALQVESAAPSDHLAPSEHHAPSDRHAPSDHAAPLDHDAPLDHAALSKDAPSSHRSSSKAPPAGETRADPSLVLRPTLTSLELLPRLVNDLEPAAFVVNPQLARLRARCEAKLGRPVRMSGSGSTLFTLYDVAADAKAAQAVISGVPTRVVTLAP